MDLSCRTYYPWFGLPMCTHFSTKFSEKRLPVVALVSFPSSGNSWLRFLVEGATGIFSGSVYKDTRMSSGNTHFLYCQPLSNLTKNLVASSWLLRRNAAPQLWPDSCGQKPWSEGRHVRQVSGESHTPDQEPIQGTEIFSQSQVWRET